MKDGGRGERADLGESEGEKNKKNEKGKEQDNNEV
jgi:hypothetical protein